VRASASPPLLDVRFPDGVPFTTAREHEEVLSLVRRLVAASGLGDPDASPGAVSLEPLTGGRSGAWVFKLTPLAGTGRPAGSPPVIVKIAPRAQGLREKANYDTFVRPGLPAACRAELLGVAGSRHRFALCYAFAGGRDGSRPETLTDHLQRGDTAALDRVLRDIVEPLRDTWYGPDQIREEGDIARLYLKRYFAGKAGAARDGAALRACAARYFGAHYVGARQKGARCVIGEVSFPSPDAVLFAHGLKRPCHSCIVHGDLNTDNIVVAPDRGGVTLIDFQKTGRGHVYQDLASLESSIRINFPPDAPYGDILETERLIALGRPDARATPYAAAIRAIRAVAFRQFGGIEDDATYPFAIAVLGLRLMEAVDLSDVARARIAISALWAAKVLADEPPA